MGKKFIFEDIHR